MKEFTYERPIVDRVLQGLAAKKRLLQIIIGPRQVGKTTASIQIAEKWKGPVVNATADSPLPPGPEWIRAQWNLALAKAGKSTDKNDKTSVLLILDEVQKVKGWSEAIKELWDVEARKKQGINVIMLGSSSLLLQKGLYREPFRKVLSPQVRALDTR